jgi:Fe-S-cluster containining protein
MPPLPVTPPDGYSATDAFMYTCHRCRRCCSNKVIHVNPYEVYRLARNRGLSTTAFLREHTISGGTELARREDSSCVFLTPQGCGVHADRPLVCRLYPLGRRITKGQSDTYYITETHPESDGVFSDDGTVTAYLESQGVSPFAAAVDRYYDLILRIGETISAHAALNQEARAETSAVLGTPPEPQEWLDIDAVIGRDEAEVTTAAAAMDRHIAMLERQFLCDALPEATVHSTPTEEPHE